MSREKALSDALDGGPSVAARGSSVAGRHRLAPRFVSDGRGLRLELRDHVVYLAPRLADLRLELFVQALAKRLFPLPQHVFALVHPRLGGVERLSFLRRKAMLVLERAHVAVDLGEMLGELRFARAEVLARRGHD